MRTLFTTADKIPNSDLVSSGDADLDSAIPIYTRAVYTIYGPPGVGKSNLALAYCMTAIQTGGKCVWIDTEGKFPRARAEAVAKARGVENWFNNLFYARVKTVGELKQAVFELVKLSVYGKVVVIDTIINPFRQDRQYQGLKNLARRQQELAGILGDLNRFAYVNNAVVFTITHSVETVMGRDKHSGGHILAHMTRVLRVDKLDSARVIRAEKVPDLPDVVVYFDLCDYGVCAKSR